MTGGGSAGHITPILSVASELKKTHPQAEIRYVGQFGDSMSSIVASEPSITGSWAIFAGKWRRYHGVGFWAHIRDWKAIVFNARDLILFCFGFIQSIWLLIWWRPNVIFVKGGYVGLPVGLAAACLRVPLVTHDSDVLPGLTNRILSRYAKKLCVGLPTKYYKTYPSIKTVQTGIPIRAEYVPVTSHQQHAARQEMGIPDNATVIAVVGGSLGAVRLNDAFINVADELLTQKSTYILHVCGARQYEEIARFYESLPKAKKKRTQLWSFTDSIYKITAASTLVISRAGATSIAELGMQKKPVLVVPNPILTGGHQTYNAKLLLADKSVLVVSEQQLDDHAFNFGIYIQDALNDTKTLNQIANNLHNNTKPRAAANIARIIVKAVG